MPTVDLVCRLVTDSTGTVLHLSGEIDLSTLPHLHDQLSRAAAAVGGATLRVDLDGVTALDDAGLGVLLGWAGRLREAGSEMVLVATSERLRRRLELTGVHRAITLADPAAS